MAYPNTNSRLETFISTSLSTQILVEVDNKKVGAIQNMTIRQNRTVQRVSEVGFDGVLEVVPNSAPEVELTVTRITFDGLSLPLAFGRPFHNIKSQRIPFTIKVFDTMYAQAGEAPDFSPVANSPGMVIHEYKNCWFTQLSGSYQVREYIITQEATIIPEDVVTYFANGTTSPALPGDDFFSGYLGGPGAGNLAYNIETTTDVGRRGTLDAASLGLLLNDAPIFGGG
jgi:hypothetical protein